jgi:hypothetical protein
MKVSDLLRSAGNHYDISKSPQSVDVYLNPEKVEKKGKVYVFTGQAAFVAGNKHVGHPYTLKLDPQTKVVSVTCQDPFQSDLIQSAARSRVAELIELGHWKAGD